jgi:multidrug transporter EmrE-like cation transporter
MAKKCHGGLWPLVSRFVLISVACNALSCAHGALSNTYTIFEGTSAVQRLVISRAISGIHIN